MRVRLGRWFGLALMMLIAVDGLGCGSGKTAVIGLGNSGNRIVEDGLLEKVAEALAAHPTTPAVTDETLVQIFTAIQRRAGAGDPEAALMVLLVAEQQRKEKKG